MNITERIAKSKCLKIVITVIPNSGHMIPVTRIAVGLQEKGHDVTLISNGNKDGSERVPKLLDPLGIKYVLTKGGPEQELMFENPAGMKESGQEKYFEKWNPIGIEACKELKPDIIICDFMS